MIYSQTSSQDFFLTRKKLYKQMFIKIIKILNVCVRLNECRTQFYECSIILFIRICINTLKFYTSTFGTISLTTN